MTAPLPPVNAALAQYEATFAEPLAHPPLDYGYFTLEQLSEIAEEALRKGQPVRNWSEYLQPLPPDAVS